MTVALVWLVLLVGALVGAAITMIAFVLGVAVNQWRHHRQ